jgi:hypothetical protein
MEEREKRQFLKLGVTAQLEKPFTQQKLQEALKASALVLGPKGKEKEAEGAEQPGVLETISVLAAAP